MNRPLARLARLYGIQTSYVGLRGVRKHASPDALLAVLGAMGAPVRNADDATRLFRELEKKKKWEAEPVVVAWDGRLDERVRRKLGGSTTAEKLPMGYHVIKDTLIISAPMRAYFPFDEPAWGIFSPVYALHSKRTMSVGDLTDLEAMVSWMSELGGKVAGTLPLLANFIDEPFEPSPYSPASRLFWNELYIDVERSAEFSNAPKARRLHTTGPHSSSLIDYREAMRRKRAVLEALAEAFFNRGSGQRRESYERFLRGERNMRNYARFRAVTDRRGSGWSHWPTRLRSGRITPADYDRNAEQYYLYSQWIIQEQLQALSIRAKANNGTLYLDLPLGLHPEAYDTWRYPELFVHGMSGGAPPDIVFTTGQNWNLPPMNPQAMRQYRHRYTIEYLRNHMRYAGLLRIDHVMGLHRFFWIPSGMPVSEGVYVEYPSEELYAILSVESHRYRAGVVGENLGNVPPIVTASMRRHNVQEMYVAQYALSGNHGIDGLREIHPNAVASLNTHDMPPFHAFLEGLDIPDKVKLNFIDKKAAQAEARDRKRLKSSLLSFLRLRKGKPDDVVRECLKLLGRSKARLVLVNLEDLWCEVKPQNIPATSSQERPNWRRRLRYSIERIQRDRRVDRSLRELNNVRNTSD